MENKLEIVSHGLQFYKREKCPECRSTDLTVSVVNDEDDLEAHRAGEVIMIEVVCEICGCVFTISRIKEGSVENDS